MTLPPRANPLSRRVHLCLTCVDRVLRSGPALPAAECAELNPESFLTDPAALSALGSLLGPLAFFLAPTSAVEEAVFGPEPADAPAPAGAAEPA